MNVISRILGSGLKDVNNEDYTPYKIAQRVISIAIISAYLMSWMCALLMFIVSYWDKEAKVIALIISESNSTTLSMPVMIIVGFYFASGAAEGVIKKLQAGKDIKKPPQ